MDRESARAFARSLPGLLSGSVPEPTGVLARCLRVVGVEALSILRQAFVDKARGGADESGLTWAPLAPATVAYGRRHPGLAAARTRAGKAGRAGRPLLTAAQDRLWRGVFARTLARQKGAGLAPDQGKAAALAWALVKAAGGRTVLGEYGKERVEVGRDTGRLLASLGPDGQQGDTILEARPGEVRVGTNVAYARHFFAARPLAPDAWPGAWVGRLKLSLADALTAFLRERGR